MGATTATAAPTTGGWWRRRRAGGAAADLRGRPANTSQGAIWGSGNAPAIDSTRRHLDLDRQRLERELQLPGVGDQARPEPGRARLLGAVELVEPRRERHRPRLDHAAAAPGRAGCSRSARPASDTCCRHPSLGGEGAAPAYQAGVCSGSWGGGIYEGGVIYVACSDGMHALTLERNRRHVRPDVWVDRQPERGRAADLRRGPRLVGGHGQRHAVRAGPQHRRDQVLGEPRRVRALHLAERRRRPAVRRRRRRCHGLPDRRRRRPHRSALVSPTPRGRRHLPRPSVRPDAGTVAFTTAAAIPAARRSPCAPGRRRARDPVAGGTRSPPRTPATLLGVGGR